jgi:hypothetical protein
VTTEYADYVTLTVQRDHGLNKTIDLLVSVTDGTARRGLDYEFSRDGSLSKRDDGNYYLQFFEGEITKAFMI